MSNEIKNYSPQERAAMFNTLTRQHEGLVESQTGAENGVLRFQIPKTQLLAGAKLKINCVLTATHSSETVYVPHEDSPWKFLRRIKLSYNGHFDPFSISGQGLALYNRTLRRAADYNTATSGRAPIVQPLVCSSGGTANAVQMIVDLPTKLNPRDTMGLIMANNNETLVDVELSLGTVADLAPASSGFTLAVSAIVVSLITETFSIPAPIQARPSVSTLKLVTERLENMIVGENTFKLPTDLVYRKLGFIVYNATPVRLADSVITGNVEIVLNTTKIPYKIPAAVLAAKNFVQYASALPTGMFMFDFSDNGIPNLGGIRDYIDTRQLTEFWLRFTSTTAGTCRIVYEAANNLGES